MRLSKEDGLLFYKLWFPLLDFVNARRKVVSELRDITHAEELDPRQVKKVASVLWSDTRIIDSYLKVSGGKLTEEEYGIVSRWKRCLNGSFIMERHLPGGSILISENANVYQVSGIITSLEEMFEGAPLPLLIEATLIPFRDVIITDGLILPYDGILDQHVEYTVHEIYQNAKKEGQIRTSL